MNTEIANYPIIITHYGLPDKSPEKCHYPFDITFLLTLNPTTYETIALATVNAQIA